MGLRSIDNEKEILMEIAGGCEQAFAKLFHGYVHQAGHIIHPIIGSREQTEEILQDIFVKLWNDREKLVHIKQFNAYFFILLRNYTLNYLSVLVAERKKQQQYRLFAETQDDKETPVAYKHADILDKAIEALPMQQKTVFLLRAQGYKNPEIASRMHLSTDSVKKYNQLALKFIYRYIKVKETMLLSVVVLRLFK
ncbi:sigma-70 family RNA polymerase sigma factor [Chitinophaga arvensicola]|uniref:RNA polymerase sigma-70 factor, ECF subfamily n=1 Tax=Chitinophaga arvensicola TaxID=29529 RepID=A0A1I0QRU6_9BACT|nr:sigma-70 family RNA polymerase sigma factor [Chitinophaga arvensicola]SEW30266.1 RNA polymerase sigma-70 factor, ECF subfamily [Chitinophaga arvensicola]